MPLPQAIPKLARSVPASACALRTRAIAAETGRRAPTG
jgi:hypothetical protein